MAGGSDWETLWARRIQEIVEGMRYGTIQITVHDGRIVQIERTEKFRHDRTDHAQDRRGKGGPKA